MRIIAVTNIKGGVGKTTTAVNLAYEAARSGQRTVLWDLDAQGAATWLLRVESAAPLSAKKLVRGDHALSDAIEVTDYPGLHVLPADASYADLERHLRERKRPERRLLKLSRELHEDYDLLLLDCPPGMSLLTENVLRAADWIVVPVIPAPLSARMLGELAQHIAAEQWADLLLLPFGSMIDRRRALHVEGMGVLRSGSPPLLATEVPYSSEIERMSVRRAPVAAYAPRSAAAAVYAALYAEIMATRAAAPPGGAAAPPPH